MYIAYHLTSDPTKFGGEGWVKVLYFGILISHILLSIALIPLVLISFVRGISQQFTQHRKIARITFPIWLYVTSYWCYCLLYDFSILQLTTVFLNEKTILLIYNSCFSSAHVDVRGSMLLCVEQYLNRKKDSKQLKESITE